MRKVKGGVYAAAGMAHGAPPRRFSSGHINRWQEMPPTREVVILPGCGCAPCPRVLWVQYGLTPILTPTPTHNHAQWRTNGDKNSL